MKTRVSGYKTEMLAKKLLESHGYVVDKKPNVRFQSPDLFGCFDLVALKGSRTLWIQVKLGKNNLSKGRGDVRGFVTQHDLKIEAYVLAYIDSQWKWELYTGDSKNGFEAVEPPL